MYFATPSWDAALFQRVNFAWHGRLLDGIMPAVSHPLLLWAVALAAVLVFARRMGARRTVCVLLVLGASVALADLSCHGVKELTGRIRPYNALPGVRYIENHAWAQRPPAFTPAKDHGSSFPSAHAANAMAVAMACVLALGWRRVRWALLLPLVVGYSRVYLGKHYPSDVAAGWLLGIAAAVAVHALWLLLTRDTSGTGAER
ncbi:MAG: phosphatase PAP2 family protein [Desulfovibrionaceae bacterium]